MPRLPELLNREDLPEGSRHIHDYIMSARGKIANSYAVMFHAPELVDRIVRVATNLRFESSLSKVALELIALTVCAELDNLYEIGVHTSSAVKAGIDPRTIEALQAKEPITGVNEETAMVVACARELVRTHELSDRGFEHLHRALGNQGAVEFVGAVGFYSMLSLMQNALKVRPQGS